MVSPPKRRDTDENAKLRQLGTFLAPSAILGLQPCARIYMSRLTQGCGCSSGVERYLAKVNVVSSNLITRSIFSKQINAFGFVIALLSFTSAPAEQGNVTGYCNLERAPYGEIMLIPGIL